MTKYKSSLSITSAGGSCDLLLHILSIFYTFFALSALRTEDCFKKEKSEQKKHECEASPNGAARYFGEMFRKAMLVEDGHRNLGTAATQLRPL